MKLYSEHHSRDNPTSSDVEKDRLSPTFWKGLLRTKQTNRERERESKRVREADREGTV